MIIAWLTIWVLWGAPALNGGDVLGLSSWAIALTLCLFVDIARRLERRAARRAAAMWLAERKATGG